MPGTARLGQKIAIEAQIRKDSMRRLTEAYHALSKPDLLDGIHGTYEPRDDLGDRLPPEGKRVQATVEEMVTKTHEVLVEMYNATAARDFTNATEGARADVVVDGAALIEKAPVPYLLWLDKQLDELKAFANRMPTLSPSTTWTPTGERGVFVSEAVVVSRSVPKPTVIELSPATDKFPANARLEVVPTVVGDWTRRKYSGAVPVERKEKILNRIHAMKVAVAAAKAEANQAEAVTPDVGARVMDYLFG